MIFMISAWAVAYKKKNVYFRIRAGLDHVWTAPFWPTDFMESNTALFFSAIFTLKVYNVQQCGNDLLAQILGSLSLDRTSTTC